MSVRLVGELATTSDGTLGLTGSSHPDATTSTNAGSRARTKERNMHRRCVMANPSLQLSGESGMRSRVSPVVGVALVALIVTLSCSSETITEPVSTIRLFPETPSLLIGSTVRLEPFTLAGASFGEASGKWSSSAGEIVSVDERGYITGKAAGSATIRLDAGDTFAETIVNVVAGQSALSAGVTTTCGLTTGGELYCWGVNDYGQAGMGDLQTPILTPRKVAGTSTFTSVSVGRTHSCGLTTTGTSCWGDNTRGQVGDGTVGIARLIPTPISGSNTFIDVDVSSTIIRTGNFECLELYVCTSRSCALSADGATFCWGNGVLVPTRLSLSPQFRAIGLGFGYGCGLDRANVPSCWGGSSFNLVAGPLVGADPARVPGDLRFQSMKAGATHACGLDFGGDIYCWGANDAGQLGSSSGGEYCIPALGVRVPCRAEPRQVETDFKFIALSVGESSSLRVAYPAGHTCGLATTLQIVCWGSNFSGQLGNGSTQSTQIPEPVSSALRFRSVSVGYGHTCGVTVDGDAYCWGAGGSLGSGTTTSSPTPVAVAGGLKFR